MAAETAEQNDAAEETKLPLNLTVDIKKPSACERHVTVVISGEDVTRYLDASRFAVSRKP